MIMSMAIFKGGVQRSDRMARSALGAASVAVGLCCGTAALSQQSNEAPPASAPTSQQSAVPPAGSSGPQPAPGTQVTEPAPDARHGGTLTPVEVKPRQQKKPAAAQSESQAAAARRSGTRTRAPAANPAVASTVALPPLPGQAAW